MTNGIINLANIFNTSTNKIFTIAIVIIPTAYTFVKLFFTSINLIFQITRGGNDKKQTQNFIGGKGFELLQIK